MNAIDKVSDKRNHVSKPKRIAMYVIYDKDGILDGYRKYYLKELRKVTDKIVAVVSGTLTPESRDELEKLVEDVLVRENVGLLAGSWIDGIKYIGWNELYKYDELLMLNDSFFGPFYPLEIMFEKMEESDADFYGAFQNFEEKSYTDMMGRSFKHGHFRGSICYFYIIKRRLLHSPEFKKYWSQQPKIKEDWDTYFFAEIDFYDYVLDAGFRIDAYQTEALKGYFFDNLTHNMEKLVSNEKIPFARIRPFCTDLKDQSFQISYGQDPRKTLDYITRNTEYDENLIWSYILRTKNLTQIWNQLQLEYVISKDCVEKTYNYNKKIAVILHIYYKDQVKKITNYCKNFPHNTDFYVTTTDEETLKEIEINLEKESINFVCKIRPNIGVAMSTLWITYADIITKGDYEYICYFHDKKSPYSQFAMHGDQFGLRCYENLFGTPEIVKNIINLFEENPRLGMLGAPMVYHGDYFEVALRSWHINYKNTVNLVQKLGLAVNINPDIMPVAPYGDMFWFRRKALKKAISYGFTYDDFNIAYSSDGTILHAIERVYGFAVQDSGYYYAEVINSDEARSDLINYQYMLNEISSILIQNGHNPYNYEVLKNILRHYKGQPLSLKLTIKHKLKQHCPPIIWNIAKRIYHFFGGQKWIG